MSKQPDPYGLTPKRDTPLQRLPQSTRVARYSHQGAD